MEEQEKSIIHGQVDLECIKEVKENVSIPVIREWRYKKCKRCYKNV